MLIPPILHRVWIGTRSIPGSAEYFWERWRTLHPKWTLHTWTDNNRPLLKNEATFQAVSNVGLKSDLLRYELLLQHGGIYVDVDMEPLRAIDPLVQFIRCFACREFRARDGRMKIGNAILGAVPRHPAIAALVEALPYRVVALPPGKLSKAAVVSASGPGLLTDIWANFEQTTVFESDVFFPFSWKEKHKASKEFPNAFTKHHWHYSWREQDATTGPAQAQGGGE